MNEPKLRFKADDGSQFPDWKEKKIGDLFYKVNERNNGQFGKDKWISVAKMYYQDEDKVTSNNIDTRTYVMRIGDMAFEGHPNKEFKYGRFVVNDIGDGIISELFPIYRHKGEYVLKYWKYAIQIDTIMQKIYRKAITSSGASSNKLDNNDFENQNIPVPSLPEQQKIAEFLLTIDTVIEKQKETVSVWEERKKGVMQKLFSQEVRFKADDGSDFPDWEKKYLSDIASFHSGLTYTPDDVVDSENGILVFRSSNIQNGRIAYDDNVYVDKELKEKNYVKLHDIVVCVRNGSKSLVGKNALVTESDLNATWGAFMTVIRAKQNYEFVHQYLNSTFFKKEMYKDSGTATINQITTAMLNGCKLFVPSLVEQQKIADCLSSLDEVIEKQKATLAAWEELKKGLLQQMFV